MKKLLVLMSIVLTSGMLSAATWNLTDDWSDSSNPNSPWSYGGDTTSQDADDITFTSASTHTTTWMSDLFPSSGGPAWYRASSPQIIGLAKAGADAATIDIDQGEVFAHGGGVFRWTAPSAMTIVVSGKVWRTRNSSNIDVWLLENGNWSNNSASQRHQIGTLPYNSYTGDAPLYFGPMKFTVSSGQNVHLVIAGNDFCGADLTIEEIGDTWNLTDDWSDVSNPNSPWSYGGDTNDQDADDMTFTTASTHTTTWMSDLFPPSGGPAWYRASSPAIIGLAKAADDATGIDIVQGEVFAHAGGIFRWTAPSAMTVVVTGKVWRTRNNDSLDIWLLEDGDWSNNSASQRHQIGTLPYNTYTGDAPLYFGPIRFTVSSGQNVQLVIAGNDFCGADLTITDSTSSVWDLAREWSDDANPGNIVWSYGGDATNQDADDISFTSASTHTTTWMSDLFPSSGGPAWYKASSPAIIGLARAGADAATIDIQKGDVFAHGGGVFRWTAPSAMTVKVAGDVWRTRNSSSIDIWLLEDGDWSNNTSAQRHQIGSIASSTYPRSAPLAYGYTFDVTSGQNVQLVVAGNDFAGVNMTVVKDPVSTTQEYYVSTSGSDYNAGTKLAPFKTIACAQAKVRELISAGLNRDVVVYLREGSHYLDDTLWFGPEDSGTVANSITYTSYPGENAVISGGELITGWTSIGNSKYTKTLSDVASGDWWFRQLWRNESRCIRSRTVDYTASSVSADKKVITLSATPPASGNMVANKTELVMLHIWAHSRCLLAGELSSNVVTTSLPNGIPDGGGEACMATVGDICYLEHNPDYINQDTEWHLNPSNGVLTIQCVSAPSNYSIVAPKLDKLIVIRGSDESVPVRNLHFEGITFKHTNLSLPSNGGYAGFQASVHKTPNTGSGTIYRYIIPPAVQMTYAQGCTVEKCLFRNLAQTAIALAEGTNNCKVIDCEVNDVGGAGIDVGYRGGDDPYGAIFGTGTGNADADWIDSSDEPQHNVISNNYIHDCAAEWFGCTGIMECFTNGTEISKNIITDLPYTGLSSGFKWNDDVTSEDDIVIKQNHIHDVMQLLDDGGGIYTLGNHQGGLIDENLIYDVYDNVGFYNDQGSSYFTIEDNIVYNCLATYMWHCNQCVEETFTWGTNYWDDDYGTYPTQPQWIIDGAGTAPAAPTVSIELVGSNVEVTGSCEAWADISTAVVKENSQNISSYLTVKQNGAIDGSIPTGVISSTTTVTIQIVTLDPDGDTSSAGESNTINVTW